MTATVPAPTGFEPLDPAIREQYDRDGFVVIPNALPEEDRAYFEDAVDRIYGEEEAAGELRPDRSIHVMGWLHRDPRFVELLTWPRTFPYIWGTMGWNIYTHHNHIDVSPGRKAEQPYWGWHQDGYRQNSDIRHGRTAGRCSDEDRLRPHRPVRARLRQHQGHPRQPQEQHALRPAREAGRPDHRARGRRRDAAQPR